MNDSKEKVMKDLNKVIEMNDRQIQDWLRKISLEADFNALPIALTGADDEIKDCIFRNLSTHAKTAIEKSIKDQKKISALEIQRNINIIMSLI